MRLFILVLCVITLVILGSQLRAGPEIASAPAGADATALPLVVGTTFPEPISTVFILAGAAAMGLWKLARRFNLV